MAVSSKTVNQIVSTILAHKKDFEIDELVKVTSFSKPTVRQAINIAMLQGSVIKIPASYPAKYKAVDKIPQLGETLIIKEIAPPPELDREMMTKIRLSMAKDEFGDTLSDQIAERYVKSSPTERSVLKDFLINFAEVIKEDMAAAKSLDLSDIKIGKK